MNDLIFRKHEKKSNSSFSKKALSLLAVVILSGSVCACSNKTDTSNSDALNSGDITNQDIQSSGNVSTTIGDSESPEGSKAAKRDNTPKCLTPVASGSVIYENDVVSLDCSNSSEGYICVKYTGSNTKVKFQLTGPDSVTYTYNLSTNASGYEVFPLSAGSGAYSAAVYENIKSTQYSTAFTQNFKAELSDEFLPFLYPNQYVSFDKNTKAVALAKDLVKDSSDDLEAVTAVYDYITANITYDYDEASTVKSGYIPDIDEVLSTKKGICLDYACLMSAMLRSQNIPTRMEVGYAGTTYHAWISTYITNVGWVNGIIQFDGTSWSLMDPTFATTTSAKELKSYISNKSNYVTKYIY